MIRAKGHFWLATRPDWCGELSIAGAVCRTSAMGFWWVAVPKTRWPQSEEWRQMVKRHWHPVYGDRRQELVFIGTGMDEVAMRAALDGCLVGRASATRFDAEAFAGLPDPFPAWRREAEAA